VGKEESNQEKEKDYRAMIKARAEQAKNLRQTLKEAKGESLRQKVELEKEKEKEK
jgi:hypothetical protein